MRVAAALARRAAAQNDKTKPTEKHQLFQPTKFRLRMYFGRTNPIRDTHVADRNSGRTKPILAHTTAARFDKTKPTGKTMQCQGL
jgi:hypothetical protein